MAREREKDRGGEKRTGIKDKGGVRKFEWERDCQRKRMKGKFNENIRGLEYGGKGNRCKTIADGQ